MTIGVERESERPLLGLALRPFRRAAALAVRR